MAREKIILACNECKNRNYFDSLWPVCFRQNRQYLLISSRSVVFFLFFVVL